jgi:hypothetical protein
VKSIYFDLAENKRLGEALALVKQQQAFTHRTSDQEAARVFAETRHLVAVTLC